MMTGDELDSIELIPPAAERVAARALVLVVIACRSSLEADARDPEAEALRQQIVAWLRSVGIDRELEDRERMMLEAPLATLDHRTVINASWEGEGAAALAWASDAPRDSSGSSRGLIADPALRPSPCIWLAWTRIRGASQS